VTTLPEMKDRCAKCSNENVVCLYGAASLIKEARTQQKKKDAKKAREMIGARPREIAQAILEQDVDEP